jgi:histone acetyltransferase 1
MSNPEEWAADSNEAFTIELVGPLDSDPLSFHPEFTYPIFGNEQTIYGYKGLKIELSLAKWDLRGYLKVTWSHKIDSSAEVEIEDVVETLKEYLPSGARQL